METDEETGFKVYLSDSDLVIVFEGGCFHIGHGRPPLSITKNNFTL